MTLTIKIDETLFVKNTKIEFDDSDIYCGRAAKFAILHNLAEELISDEFLKNKVKNYCQENIEKLAHIE
jgi:hypothetical protein